MALSCTGAFKASEVIETLFGDQKMSLLIHKNKNSSPQVLSLGQQHLFQKKM